MFWIIKHIAEGRTVRDGYLYMIIVMMFFFGWVSVRINQEFVLEVFLFGLSVPEGAPLGFALVKKLHLFGTSFFLPIFVIASTCMLKADFSNFLSSNWYLIITFTVLIVHFLKTISCILPTLYCNIPMRDSLTLALILNFNGVVKIGIYCFFCDNQVGILVTRASHKIRDSSTVTRVALIYLGGSHDDQEALCIAKRAIRSPGVNLVGYHLMDDSDFGEDDDVMILEDAYNVEYEEIITMDGSHTAGFLRKVVNEYDFFIVGRNHGIHAPQTDGLTKWSEFPELGVMGDFIASLDLEFQGPILNISGTKVNDFKYFRD